MSTDTNDEMIRLLAARTRWCLLHEIGNNYARQASLPGCSKCSGSGLVPLLPVLRRECPCIRGLRAIEAMVHIETVWWMICDGCKQEEVDGPHQSCETCKGSRWVPNLEADTGAIIDALWSEGFDLMPHIMNPEGSFIGSHGPFRQAVLQAAVAATEAGA